MPNLHEANLKFCNKCSKWKLQGHYNKDSKSPDKLSYVCRECRKSYRRDAEVKARTAAYNKKYATQNPELMRKKDRKNSLKRFWNMTEEQYNKLLIDQKGKCGVCERTESNPHKRLCIDHNHQTGLIRGLLCDHCNRALGLLDDSIQKLQSALLYLQKV